MALTDPDVNADLHFAVKVGTSHKKRPHPLLKTPFTPSNSLFPHVKERPSVSTGPPCCHTIYYSACFHPASSAAAIRRPRRGRSNAPS